MKLDGRPLITDGHRGEMAKEAANKKAAAEIAVYKQRLRFEKESTGEKLLSDLLAKARDLRPKREPSERSG